MSSYAYIVIGPNDDDCYKCVILERLRQGYKILAVTATARSVHYVMKKDK